MNRIRRSSFARSFLLAFALTILLGACQKWVEVEPPQLVLQEQADKPVQDRDELRFHTRTDAETLEGDPIVVGPDSVVLEKGEGRVTVPIEDVRRVDVRRIDTAATVVAVVGIAVGAAVTAAFVALAINDFEIID